MSDLSQYIFSGLSVGCVYAFVALGLVIVAQVTGVFNFATGEYVMVGGMIAAITNQAGWAVPFSVLAAIVVVAGVAVAQERLTVAPVRGKVTPLGMVIASLGVGVALRGAALLIWTEDQRRADPWKGGTFDLLGATLANQVMWIYISTAVALALVVLLLTRTDTGRAMRASAINPVAARLGGIRIGTMSMFAFALAGALCGLIAAVAASVSIVKWDAGVTIGLVGFIAAALAGFDSPGKAVLAGLGLGVVEALAAGLISTEYRQAIVYGTLIVYLLARDFYGQEGVVSRAIKARRASAAGSEDAPDLREKIRERVHAVEDYVRARAIVGEEVAGGPIARIKALAGRRPTLLMLLPLVMLVIAWFYPSMTTDVGALDTGVFIVLAAIAATGLGLVMGLGGQFSLGQGAFMLVSGYFAAIVTAKHGWNPLLAMIVATAVAAAIGLLVGWITLRLEGLNLALATLAILVILIVVAQRQESLTGGIAGLSGVSPFKIFGKTIEEPDGFFKLALVILAITLVIARNVWKSKMGRTLRAVGLDLEAAESLGLNSWKLKLKIVILGAAMAGVSGVLWTYYLQFASPEVWDIKLTIDLVTYVIVGGVLSPFGGAVGALAVGALQYIVREKIAPPSAGTTSTLEILLSGALLVLFVLVFRNGLVALPHTIGRLVRKVTGREAAAMAAAEALAEEEGSAASLTPAAARLAGAGEQMEPLKAETPLVVVDGLTKRFGNLIAVNGVSFTLRPGYVTAMIGPNGAGKSTVINMLSGTLLPTDGAVGVLGRPVVGLQQHQIASLGLARTFQTPRLFEGMTLLETVQLARDPFGNRWWLLGAALRTPWALRDEVESREQALAWLTYVGLAEDADRLATSLTTGKQRLAELARALATEPTILLLDEPAAGLDGGETRMLAQIIRKVADAGIAVLLVEHDMGMVMSIADHIVVLEEGKKIAEGPPSEIGTNQTVIDAYLGVVHA